MVALVMEMEMASWMLEAKGLNRQEPRMTSLNADSCTQSAENDPTLQHNISLAKPFEETHCAPHNLAPPRFQY